MNLKWALVTVLLALALLQTIEAEKERKSRRKSLTKGKSGRPRIRSTKMSRGSVIGKIDSADSVVLKCQFLERNFGEGARGIQIRKCKVKRPQKRKLNLVCEYGDFLCSRCEADKCQSFKKNKKVFLYQMAKKIIAGIKQDPISKEFFCGRKEVQHEEDSCRLSFPFSSNFVEYKPRTKPKTTFAPTSTVLVTDTPEKDEGAVHKNCEQDPHQFFCNTFMSWGNFVFNKPFEN